MGMKQAEVVLYKDKSKEWRWRFVSSNGNVMAESGESYKNKRDCFAAAKYVAQDLLFAVLTVGAKR